jgi:hypothetical protein
MSNTNRDISRHLLILLTLAIVGGLSMILARLILHADGADVVIASPAVADTLRVGKSLDRDLEPVIIEGGAISGFAGFAVDELFVYAYADGVWRQIPAQVDEVTPVGAYATTEDGLLDGNDEVVFMAKDLGDEAGHELPTVGGERVGDAWYEVEVSDPTSATKRGWAYLVHSSVATPTFTSDYVDFDAGEHRISGTEYSLGLATSHRGFDYMALGGSGVDILDRTKIRIYCSIPVLCPVTEDDMQAKPDDLVKDGPVRVILQGGKGLAYGSMVEWRPRFNILEGDVLFSTDFNAVVSGATYYNAVAPNGVTVDGITDTVATDPLSTWWQLSASNGTVLQVSDTGPIGGQQSNYYRDNSDLDASDTGDQQQYAETGVYVADPDSLSFTYPFAIYFLSGPQSNVGDTYRAYASHPLSVTTRPKRPELPVKIYLPVAMKRYVPTGFTPDDVRLGDPDVSYVNMEFSPDMAYAAWVEVRLPPFLPSRAWLCGVDRETGDLIPSDGRGFLIDEIKNRGWVDGAPQWGEDLWGPFVIVIDLDDHLLMARPQSPTEATVTALPTAPNSSRLYPFPARLPDRRDSYVAYLQHDDEGEYQSWYVDLAEPTIEHQVTFGPPGLYPPMDSIPLAINSNRWFSGEPIYIFGYTNTVSSKLQIKQVDVTQPGSEPVVITDDGYDHIDEFPAVISGERYLIGGINNEAVGMLYRRPPGGEIYEPTQVISPVGTDLVTPTSALSFEAFTWEGKAYASFQIRDNSSGVLARTEPGEIWLTSLLDGSLLRRISDPRTMVRADPEFYIGTSQVWVFYVAKPVGSTKWELHRAATGLVRRTGD